MTLEKTLGSVNCLGNEEDLEDGKVDTTNGKMQSEKALQTPQ